MFRFPSKGDHLPGVPQTDLVVVIRYQQDGVFSVPTHTLDLQCSLAITLYESLVGFTRTVIHPDGTNHHLEGMSVTKPAVYVVPGHGIRFVQDERRGDLYVDIHVEYPTTVDLRANTLRSILCTDQDAPSAVSAHQEYHPLISIDNATSIRVDDILAHNHQTIYPTRNV
jgi:DnaJ-class molecular chaperone